MKLKVTHVGIVGGLIIVETVLKNGIDMSLLRDNPNELFLIVDVETENLRLIGKNRPWQISYMVYQNGKTLEIKDFYIKWDDLDISKDAARITRFDRNKYEKNAVDAEKALDEFEKYLNNESSVILWHNGHAFDCFVIKNWREALGKKNDYSYLDRAIDTNALARAVKKGVKKIDRKDWKLMMFRFASYREKGLKTNLTALGKEFGIQVDYECLHDSQKDVILTAKVFEKLKWMIEI